MFWASSLEFGEEGEMFEWVGRVHWKFVRRETVVEWCRQGHWELVMRALKGK